MTYTYSEEIEILSNSSQFIDLYVDIEMTSPGSPATGPTYSSGGEPAEGPEFEAGTAYFFEFPKLTEKHLARLFGQSFMDNFYDRACEDAAENYDPADDEPDYDPRDD